MSSFSTFERLSQILRSAEEIPFDAASKLVFISDCHRGDGSWIDDFTHNQNIYYAAIKYYYQQGFTYFDLGDSDELWKNKRFSDISGVYTDTFRLLHQFYRDNRYYIVYGNHDIEKKIPAFVNKNLQRYYNSNTDRYEPLFKNIKTQEGLILNHKESGLKILLVHGHQGDLMSDVLWRFGRFLTRYVWRKLEFVGLKDPTSAAKNVLERRKVERKILDWVADTHQMVIAGHTHRPTCPKQGQLPYFNVGSCVHPNCITCIEIVNSELVLVKWDIKTREDRTVFVDREPIAKPRKLSDC
jgi:UDP-2,3-diacylglucosamine pyrophosphatase LpxH